MTTHFSQPKNTTLLTKCLVTLSGALVLSAAATRVEAATFRKFRFGRRRLFLLRRACH